MRVNGKPFRTIWPDSENPAIINIIDQRQLPHAFVVEPLRTVADFATAIREMHVRGAGLIGATAAFGIYSALLDATPASATRVLDQAAALLVATRPTARNLAWAVTRQREALAHGNNLEELQQIALATACAIADEDAAFCRRIGEHGLPLIAAISRRKQGAPVNILTHCNAGWLAFVDYGSATAPIYAAHQQGIPLHVWVDETRPWLQGAKLTAWELGQEGVPHTLIADNTGGHLMQHGLVDLVIVGTDRVTKSGDVANKIGTYLKALAARDNHVPFYVALPSSTFDWGISDGLAEIPIEERSGDEVRLVRGRTEDGRDETVAIAPAGTAAANYGFDVTPARLITGLITERGITPPSTTAIASLFPEFY
ncbi:MAG TPA: S-methyl-5-thioribose-1-phosphate isomerase [Desulfurivibrionaceae bacterium]|nr:S-methyl-5-thioribose-1-phosphate isomerase [Desulfurivibrionaceae bacterium]